MESIRVESSILSGVVGKTVRIVGKFTGPDASQTQPVLESNGAAVNIETDLDLSQFSVGHYYEVLGKVALDLSIKAMQVKDFGENFNEQAYIKLVEVASKVPELYQG